MMILDDDDGDEDPQMDLPLKMMMKMMMTMMTMMTIMTMMMMTFQYDESCGKLKETDTVVMKTQSNTESIVSNWRKLT